ncbi:MAG: type III pantothenate kinase [Pyrinomonadaceae bacterium]
MLLAVDIGNSATKCGIYDGKTLLSRFQFPTHSENVSTELSKDTEGSSIRKAIICSVVPAVNSQIVSVIESRFNVQPLVVTNDLDFGLTVNYHPLIAAGSDRIVNSFGALEKYGAPVMVCSFGTASTFDMVVEPRTWLGGVIAPGFATMATGLHTGAAQLPEIAITRPSKVIGTSTDECMTSGVFYGQIGLAEGIIKRIKHETGKSFKVVATGGFASFIAELVDDIDVLDDRLLLDGLQLLSERLYQA